MNCMKATRALVAAVSIAAIAIATGCNPAGVTDNTAQNKAATVFVTPTISISNTNIALETKEITRLDTDNVLNMIPIMQYPNIVQDTLMENGTVPYITFTFNKTVQYVEGTSSVPGTDTMNDQFVFAITSAGGTTTAAPKHITKIDGAGSQTIKFVLPYYETSTSTPTDDYTGFEVGKKYFIDFRVRMTDGDSGRVSLGFTPVLPRTKIGPFGDANITLYANTDEGKANYAGYWIDAKRVFYLAKASVGDHMNDPTLDEKIVVDNSSITTFTTYKSRIGNGSGAAVNRVYNSLNALANNGRTDSFVRLRITTTANATSYDIQTTDNINPNLGWYTFDEVSPTLDTDAFIDYYLNLASYPIRGNRLVRIVPKKGYFTGTPGMITLKDTINPVTDNYDEELSDTAFNVGTQTFPDHTHTNSAVEGEIINVGTKNLHILTSSETNREDYQVTGVTGNLDVATTLLNGTVLTLNQAQLTADLTKKGIMPSADVCSFVTLGTGAGAEAVGVFNKATGDLTVYIRLKCYTDPSSTLSYTSANTTVIGTLTASYADLSGNLMITRYVNSVDSTNPNGTLVIKEN